MIVSLCSNKRMIQIHDISQSYVCFYLFADVLTITKRCPNLVELDLSDGHQLTMASIEYISKGLIDLEHLCLSRCYNIAPTSYTMLASMKDLKNLDIYSLFKESSIKTLSNTLPSMKINHFPFSTVARPTVGLKRSSIWLQRVRD